MAVLQIVVVVAGISYWHKLTLSRRAGAVLRRRALHTSPRTDDIGCAAPFGDEFASHDNLSGIRQIKSFREVEEDRRSPKKRRVAVRLVVMAVWALYHSSMYLFGSLGVLLVIAVGRGYLPGAMQLGDLGAFSVLASFLTNR